MQSNTKYIHVRKIDNNGVILPNGGLTIAYVLNDQFKVVGYAAARCHSKDHYNKQIGRAKASGRLRSGQYFQHVNEMNEKEFIEKTIKGYNKSNL